ncbi:hypothetical protein OG422_23350 [Streptomyces sp. NBC_01525]|uniref:PH domain-containing protein n=1 Tax=Streptomyces benahoarensis TaxID=2595054 RepID=A0A553ZLF6_9ACTN|nr:hypothetical protein [Streptomyces benahoarensis]TSB21980.1 hypothetical protein FNJ62_16980 [Streptomyces benahoarensis]TSB42126.1 hypothetical protein FNZ23_11470 [Streptomyces benahoarensis]
MPLPFLTADRDLDVDDRTAAPPLPHEAPERWRRPYRPGPWRVGISAVALLLASFVLLSAMIIGFAGSLPGAVTCVVLALIVIGLALRLLRVGVWVSAQGLRRVGLIGTVTEPWGATGALRTVQQPVRWLGLPRTVQGQALIDRRVSGQSRVLLTDHGADFLSRPEAFERAADVLEAWAAEYRR